ncbi:MAG: 1-acyl-sn-glycerol-3-phosphate acyltransferase [Saprospirales bacterium]|nr:1-acyl-sn-glycerol-3-phosphate acyltransferase [Saprospirales bacterium]
MLGKFSRFILRIFGWKIHGWDPKLLDKYVVIVIPHTSNWDFPLGLLVRQAMDAPHLKFIGKDSLFRPPFGAIFRWLGGYPVDRSKRTHFVDSIVDLYNTQSRFVVVLSPEGSRKKWISSKPAFITSPWAPGCLLLWSNSTGVAKPLPGANHSILQALGKPISKLLKIISVGYKVSFLKIVICTRDDEFRFSLHSGRLFLNFPPLFLSPA